MPAGYDAEVAELFRDLRAASGLSEADLAGHLATRVEVVQALEQGAIYALPPWPETCRVVATYGTVLNLDVRPLLRRIYAQVEAGIVELAPKPMPEMPFMAPPEEMNRDVQQPARSPAPRGPEPLPQPPRQAAPPPPRAPQPPPDRRAQQPQQPSAPQSPPPPQRPSMPQPQMPQMQPRLQPQPSPPQWQPPQQMPQQPQWQPPQQMPQPPQWQLPQQLPQQPLWEPPQPRGASPPQARPTLPPPPLPQPPQARAAPSPRAAPAEPQKPAKPPRSRLGLLKWGLAVLAVLGVAFGLWHWLLGPSLFGSSKPQPGGKPAQGAQPSPGDPNDPRSRKADRLPGPS
jgi:hypothetical protein